MKRLFLLMLALALPLAQVVRADDDKGNQPKKNKHQAEAAAPNGAQQAAPKLGQPVKQVPPPKTTLAQRSVTNAPRSAAPTQRMITHAPRPVIPAPQSQPVKSEAQLDGRNRQSTTGSSGSQVSRTKSTTSVQRQEVGPAIIATAITLPATTSFAPRTTATGGGAVTTRPSSSSVAAITIGGTTIGTRPTATAPTTTTTSLTSRSMATIIWLLVR